MSKGLIINEDVWELIEDLDGDELVNLMACLAAYHRQDELPDRMRGVKGVFNRIVLDNERFDEDGKVSLSEIRRQAARKRWDKVAMQKAMQTDAKVYATDASMQTAQEEKRIDKNRIDKERDGRFVPPSVEQVQAYASEHGLVMDCNRFVDYFASNGWKVGGKAPMKDWQAAARNWAAREQTKRPAGKPPDYKAQLLSVDYGELLRRQG